MGGGSFANDTQYSECVFTNSMLCDVYAGIGTIPS